MNSSRTEGLGLRLVAVGVLLVAAYLVFKLVIGLIATVVWVTVAIVAVAGVIWAASVLR